MNASHSQTRRRFLQTSLLGSAAIAAANLPHATLAGPTKAACDPFDGLKVGITTYTLRKYNLDDAIKMTKKAGVKYISLKEVHLPLKSTPEQRNRRGRRLRMRGWS